MKKTSLLLSSCLVLIVSNSALAMDIRGERTSFYERNKPKPLGFNYSYIEAAYLNSTIESTVSADNKVQGIDSELSFAIMPHVAISATFNGAGYTYNTDFVKSIEIHSGATYHQPLSKTTDVYSSLKIVNISFEDPNSSDSISTTGQSLAFGLRQRISPKMEWGFKLTLFKIDGGSYSQSHLSISYGSDDELQYIAGYKNTNSDNKQKTFTLGIRYNYD